MKTRDGGKGRWAWIALLMGLGLAFVYYFLMVPRAPEPVDEGSMIEAPQRAATGEERPAMAKDTGPFATAVRETVRAPAAPVVDAMPASTDPRYEAAEASDYARELIAEVSSMAFQGDALTPEQARLIDRMFGQLAGEGAAAVEPIRVFLASMQDVWLAAFEGGEAVQYPSLRHGLIVALTRIGGPQAIEALAEVLASTVDPEEIAVVAKGLEQHRGQTRGEEIVTAARKSLVLASLADPDDSPENVAPLFALLQRYGDASVAFELEDAYVRWPEYSMLALAGLREGEGVPGLVELVHDAEGVPEHRDMAAQLLAQAARQYPEAEQALVQMAQAGKLTAAAWSKIGWVLEGKERTLLAEPVAAKTKDGTRGLAYEHVNSRAGASWTDAEIDRQLQLVDALLAAQSEPDGAKALNNARRWLLVWRENNR